jgi:hypothetical protein
VREAGEHEPGHGSEDDAEATSGRCRSSPTGRSAMPQRVMKSTLEMKKPDLAGLEQAAEAG